jgi:NTE family protein
MNAHRLATALVLLCTAASPEHSTAQPSTAPAPSAQEVLAPSGGPRAAILSPAARPRIALVLAGGGAKGAAHIGALRVLDELRIPVDCVVGTSMGALVGAVYASGIAPADIEEAVLAVDWARTVGGQGQRERMPIRRKLAPTTYSNSLEMGFGDRELRMPGGLLATQEIEQVIRTLVASARYTSNFDDLPIPFRAIATDMLAGEMVILSSGDLSSAMRASMAIPGAFSPVRLDGRVLSDGGMMRNLPVDIARDLCGDVVIAIWMSSPPPGEDSLESALSLIQRSLDLMMGANQRAQIASLGPRDVGLEVPMGDMGSADFQRVPEAIELGRAAAAERSDALRRYSVSEQDYRAWVQSLGREQTPDPVLADVQIVGTDRVSPEYVRAQLENVAPNTTASVAQIAEDVERVFAIGDFERVEYELTGPEDARVLEIAPVEKPWGPNFFRFDIGVSTYEGGDIFALARLDHDRTWINERGGRWHNALQVGRQTLLGTDFYQPLDLKQRFFVQPSAMATDELVDLYLDGDRAARYHLREVYGQVDVGLNVGTRAQIRLGMRRGEHEADLDTGLPGLPELDPTPDTSLRLRAVYDTRDSVVLPTRGTFMNARYVRSKDWLGGEQDYGLFETVLVKSFEVRGGDSMSLILSGADTFEGELPVTEQVQLGGIRSFPGLRPGELRGNGYWLAGTAYFWRLFDLQPLFGQTLYAGVRFQAAEMRERFDGVPDETLYGLSGAVGGRTPLGPFAFSIGYVDDGSWQLQFSLGRPIAEGSLLDEIY